MINTSIATVLKRQCIHSLICVFTLDRFGRRALLFWGGGVQAFALIFAGIFVHLLTVQPEKTAQFGGAAAFMVFLCESPRPPAIRTRADRGPSCVDTATFGASWLAVPWTYPAEIWPVNARAKGNAWGSLQSLPPVDANN